MQPSTILIVEDQGVIAEELSHRLRRMGFVVSGVANTADDAIRQAEAQNPDLVVMDITLTGDRDGIHAADQIKRNLGIPVIFLTAVSDHVTIRRAEATEPGCFILKPFYDRELAVNIEIALYKARAEKKRQQLEHELQLTREEIKTLRELLPLCNACNKIREDDDRWYSLESFLSKHSAAHLTHGICPDCSKQLLADFRRPADRR
jgi:DNA-binding response OmpR family regulator